MAWKIRAGKYVIGKHEATLWLGDNTNVSLNASQLIKASTGTFSSTVATTGLITATAGISGPSTETYGAGAFITSGSTEIAPSTNIMNVNEEVITTIKVDLTGLRKASDLGDVIAISGADSGASYLLQYNSATHGILSRVEMTCVEAPTAATNNLLDFDLYLNTSAALEFDGDATASSGLSIFAAAGNFALGTTKQNLVTAIVPATHDDWYLYLTDGATSTAADHFTAGKFIIKLYGFKTF